MSHPRPQMIRENWQSLDGEWLFKFDDQNIGVKEKWSEGLVTEQTIRVPFTYETELSGIEETAFHPVVWYERDISVESEKDYLIHFEGSDDKTEVWLNGQKIGENKGGYHRFSFNLKHFLQEHNKLVVRVEDSLDPSQPRGKQRWLKDNFGCWYVQTTGIWKSVWLEPVSDCYIEQLKLTPLLSSNQLECEIEINQFDRTKLIEVISEIKFQGELVSTASSSFSKVLNPTLLSVEHPEDSAWGVRKWSPATPDLYDLVLTIKVNGEIADVVKSYFGMRSIGIDGSTVLLNGHNLYQRLILDQGYWKESGLTPPSIEALELDVMRIKEMGYNGLRKHQKIEDERFLYLCDKHGLLVWSEFPATYEYNDRAVEMITHEWLKIVKQNYNHPSIITWVPFNESWGVQDIFTNKKQQQFTESIYYLTKAIDGNRPVIVNDGWVHTISDIITLHDYEEVSDLFKARYRDKEAIMTNQLMFNKDWFAFAKDYHYEGQPIIMSEFGGIAFEDESGWGYGNQVTDEATFMARFDSIHQAIQDLDYVAGFCYTQLTDVEQEVNGLLSTDREPKVTLSDVKEINERRVK